MIQLNFSFTFGLGFFFSLLVQKKNDEQFFFLVLKKWKFESGQYIYVVDSQSMWISEKKHRTTIPSHLRVKKHFPRGNFFFAFETNPDYDDDGKMKNEWNKKNKIKNLSSKEWIKKWNWIWNFLCWKFIFFMIFSNSKLPTFVAIVKFFLAIIIIIIIVQWKFLSFFFYSYI